MSACCPDGPLGEFAMALHVLEKVGAYIEWELSVAGSKPPTAGIEVLCSFDDQTATEVAFRRVLSTALPPEIAMTVVEEAGCDSSEIPTALLKLAGDTRKC